MYAAMECRLQWRNQNEFLMDFWIPDSKNRKLKSKKLSKKCFDAIFEIYVKNTRRGPIFTAKQILFV